MTKLKFSSVLILILIISVIGSTTSAFASPSANPAVLTNKSWDQSSDVIANGEKIGILKTTYQYDRKENNEGTTVVDLVVSKHYDLLPTATDIQKEVFSDNTSTYEIKATDDHEYFINGEKLTEEELNTPIASSSQFTVFASQDTGGVPSVAHYYGDYTNYHLASYSDLNIMGGPQGSNHQADGKVTNAYVQRAMSSIDTFSTDYYTMNASRTAFMVAAGLATVTVVGIISAIAAGVAGATAAGACYDAFQSCKHDLDQACNYIDRI